VAESPADEDLEAIFSEAALAGSSSEKVEDDIDIPQPQVSAPQYDPALIRNIQSGLTALGYDPGPVDGIVGRQTRTAIEAFRKREQLASGEITAELLDAITRRLSVTEPAAPAQNSSAPLQQPAPQDAIKQPWSCNSVNRKVRDCGA
jgi:peptidoglycan hydrolase-like protein with peptidoglycan-binding domain